MGHSQMQQFKFSQRSLDKLHGVHPELIAVAVLALKLSTVDFGITCGLRTLEEQKALVAAGASKTLDSRHITGDAIDVAAWIGPKLSWDMTYYQQIAVAMKQAAEHLGVPIEWGGDWITFKDGPHFQLVRS